MKLKPFLKSLPLFSVLFLIGGFASAQASALVDSHATQETQILAAMLRMTTRVGFMFGQQNATTEGVGWSDKGSNFCGDVCKVSGMHPAVYGWDFSDVLEKNEAAKEHLREKMRQVNAAGGINTLSWHFNNPVSLGPPKDLTPACERIRVGGDLNAQFGSTLDILANFLKKLKDRNGKPIPVMFRPWHEANANWFWWGTKACHPETLKKLWQFTVTRLRDRDQIHQLLWVFSPNWFPDDGMIDWPGDEWVDIVGLDFYFFKPIALLQRLQMRENLLQTVAVARQKDKIAALTEVGYETIPYSNWWTEVFLQNLTQSGISREIAYAMVWRNENSAHFYAPYPGHASTPDFLKMMRDSSSLFLEDLK